MYVANLSFIKGWVGWRRTRALYVVFQDTCSSSCTALHTRVLASSMGLNHFYIHNICYVQSLCCAPKIKCQKIKPTAPVECSGFVKMPMIGQLTQAMQLCRVLPAPFAPSHTSLCWCACQSIHASLTHYCMCFMVCWS